MTGIQHNRPDGTECRYLAATFCNKCGWFEPTRDDETSPPVADGLPPGHVAVRASSLRIVLRMAENAVDPDGMTATELSAYNRCLAATKAGE